MAGAEGAGTRQEASTRDHLVIAGVSKRFGKVVAVEDASLSVARGEILAFLGPSGCGKSTLLSVVAGFQQPDAGTVHLAGERIDTLSPSRRETAMVFQHYALFPHMTVAGNIGYGLKARGQDARTIAARVAEMVALLKLDGLEERYPAALSGGQRQRVAIARALAIRPAVLLLDEALSALDKNLREAMQIELGLLLRSLDITTIVVTHDQREAFAIGDRIALMEAGRIVQVGRAEDVYEAPGSRFAMEFLGSANRFAVGSVAEEGGAMVARTLEGLRLAVRKGPSDGAQNLCAFVRSEDVMIRTTPTLAHPEGPGRVRLATFMGDRRRVILDLGGTRVVAETAVERGAPKLSPGDPVYLDVPAGRAILLPETHGNTAA